MPATSKAPKRREISALWNDPAALSVIPTCPLPPDPIFDFIGSCPSEDQIPYSGIQMRGGGRTNGPFVQQGAKGDQVSALRNVPNLPLWVPVRPCLLDQGPIGVGGPEITPFGRSDKDFMEFYHTADKGEEGGGLRKMLDGEGDRTSRERHVLLNKGGEV